MLMELLPPLASLLPATTRAASECLRQTAMLVVGTPLLLLRRRRPPLA